MEEILFTPLKVVNPTHVWYCNNPFASQPKLEKLTVKVFSELVSKQRDTKFEYSESYFVPGKFYERIENIEEHVPYDFTVTLDKVYFANMGKYGIGTFARLDIDKGEIFGFSAGKISKEKSANINEWVHLSSISCQGANKKDYYTSTFNLGGVVGFMPWLPHGNAVMKNCATENVRVQNVNIGDFQGTMFLSNGKIKAGQPIGYNYETNGMIRYLDETNSALAIFNLYGQMVKELSYSEAIIHFMARVLLLALRNTLNQIDQNGFDATLHATSLNCTPAVTLLDLNKDELDLLSKYRNEIVEFGEAEHAVLSDPEFSVLLNKRSPQYKTSEVETSLFMYESSHCIYSFLKSNTFRDPKLGAIVKPEVPTDKSVMEKFEKALYLYKHEQYGLALRFWCDALSMRLTLHKNEEQYQLGDKCFPKGKSTVTLHWNIGNAHLKLQNKTKALKYLKLAKEIREKYPDDEKLAGCKTVEEINQKIASI